MNSNQTATAVARRLRNLKKRDVRDVLAILTEVWREELLKPDGYIHIDGLGKLYIEQQQLRSAGFIQAQLEVKHGVVPTTIPRYYFRFRPADSLRAALLTDRNGEEG